MNQSGKTIDPESIRIDSEQSWAIGTDAISKGRSVARALIAIIMQINPISSGVTD
jgi:hypothetical protein